MCKSVFGSRITRAHALLRGKNDLTSHTTIPNNQVLFYAENKTHCDHLYSTLKVTPPHPPSAIGNQYIKLFEQLPERHVLRAIIESSFR